MFFVYVLKSKKDGHCYVGSTSDLKKRFREHNAGMVQSTQARIPFEIVYFEGYRSEKDARIREKKLKLRSRAFEQLRKRISSSLS